MERMERMELDRNVKQIDIDDCEGKITGSKNT